MKGIILAGGRGTRLYPLTLPVCKQLLPVYDKPMIYYPLSVLLYAGIREILLISTPLDLPRFESLLGDGSHLGISIAYAKQEKPNGIAEAFIIGKDFIENDNVALILGDNLFYGERIFELFDIAKSLQNGAIIFGYEVKNPSRYGVMVFDEKEHLINIVEKPSLPPSDYAVTGLYFYDNQVIEIAKSLSFSKRNELEITDINLAYLKKGELQAKLFDRGFAWLDAGTCEALHSAATYVQAIQERQGIKIGCIEEISYKMGFIDQDQLQLLGKNLSSSEYGTYLLQCAKNRSILQHAKI
ncbi:MAG: glucose-1-phosphate thymidylyltransferase RfbA [Chlamydiae bacterium]|nr:glucose-1-phosphate thymidylyltransferase RfbA [Chlamydiota bacterium]